jgi:hypothetical protein
MIIENEFLQKRINFLNIKTIKFDIFAVLKVKNMKSEKKFARVVWWRYWKQPQRSLNSVGHL